MNFLRVLYVLQSISTLGTLGGKALGFVLTLYIQMVLVEIDCPIQTTSTRLFIYDSLWANVMIIIIFGITLLSRLERSLLS